MWPNLVKTLSLLDKQKQAYNGFYEKEMCERHNPKMGPNSQLHLDARQYMYMYICNILQSATGDLKTSQPFHQILLLEVQGEVSDLKKQQ